MANKHQLKKVKTALLSMQRHSWEQGVAMQAFWELGDYDTAIQLAIEAAYRTHDDGRLASIGDMVAQTDPSACGEVLLWAAKHTQIEALQQAVYNLLDFNLHKAPRNQDGILYHMNYDKSFWVDSIYMLPPFLAAAGHFDEAIKQINGYVNALFIKQKQLLGHRYDDETKTFQRDVAWATGNAWALAGFARVIDLLPQSYASQRSQLVTMAQTLHTNMLKHISQHHIFHDILDDDTSFLDGASTLLFAYSTYRGITSRWLQEDSAYLADKMFDAVTKNIDTYGFVRNVAGAPHFMTLGISPEAQSFYLLAYSAKHNLKENI